MRSALKIFKMSYHIDFRTLPANVPVLCIPRVYSNISESRIRRIFDDLNMGVLERIDIVSKKSDKGEKFNRVFVHFRRWNDTENANIARERLLNGKEIKIIYDEPWFWKISAYREAVRKPSVSQNTDNSRKATLQFDSDEEIPSKPVTSYSKPDERRRDYSRERRSPDERRRDDSRERFKTEEKRGEEKPTDIPKILEKDDSPYEGVRIEYGDINIPFRKNKSQSTTLKIEDEKAI